MVKVLSGLEILDSRGRPTVKATCIFQDGCIGMASVPSGASTGKAEAYELRDIDENRFGGFGCRKAVHHINTIINDALSGKVFKDQAEFDTELIRLDGTPNFKILGSNAVLACSLAYARAKAQQLGLPLFKYFGSIINNTSFLLPRPTINLFSGGKHAGGQIPIQDLLIVPLSAKTMDEALADCYKVYQSASKLILDKYAMRPLTADEGGLAPAFDNVEQMLDDAIASIKQAGLIPGKDVGLAMDIAASHFYNNERYTIGNKDLNSTEMVKLIHSWV